MNPSERARYALLQLLGLLATGIATFAFISCDSNAAGPSVADAPTAEPATSTPTIVEIGRTVYLQNCAVCHGVSGEGQPDWNIKKPDGTYPAPPHNGAGHTWHHADGLLYRTVRDGGEIPEVPSFKSAMPAFGGKLSPAEIRAVITYIKTFWGDEKTP